MNRYLRHAALTLHRLHQEAYSYWRVNETGVRFRSRLSAAERIFYLQLRPALTGEDIVVYDIGANVGIVTACFAKIQNVRMVHAFEPLPSASSKLMERTRRYPQVVCHRVALGDTNGQRKMHVHRSSASSSIVKMTELHLHEFPGTEFSHAEEVAVVRLDDYVREQGLPLPDMVKIDVQGYEDRVLRGGMQTISASKHCAVEMSFDLLYEPSPLFDDIYRLMREMHFRLIGIASSLPGRSGRQLQVDGLFEKDLAQR